MDFTEHRQAAIDLYELGNPDRLLKLLAANSLNANEREFIAGILRASVPKGPSGPKKCYAKPVKAALVWFWSREIDKHPKDDAIYNEIETLLGVKLSMARKYVKQMANPETQGQQWAKVFAQHEIGKRRQAIEWGDDELIRLYRQHDFAPIPAQ